MKKKFLNIIAAVSLLTASSSCTNDFEETNIDFSKQVEANSENLLNPALYEMASEAYMRANNFGFEIMQYSIPFPNEGNTVSRYYFTENTGVGYWNSTYRWQMQINEMLKLAQKEGNKNNEAVALVLRAWGFQNLTDSFGDVPFSEAFRQEENIRTPKFDQQKEVYIQLLNDLEKANSLFLLSETLKGPDQMYHANENAAGVLKWKKFCNSLSLRMLLRILEKDGEIDVKNRINKIISDPATYPIFTNNDDSAFVLATGVAPFDAPIVRPQDFTTGRAAAEFFVDYLNKTEDPRRPTFFSKARELGSNKDIGYKGAPAGYKSGTKFTYNPSNLNQALAKTPLTLKIMGYSELQFILAELALKNVIPGDAKTFYDKGVQASLEQWNAKSTPEYLNHPDVAYNGTLERIMMQKYVALFFVDQQAWYEYRRTGYPKLPNNGGLLNDGKMPVRFMYPPVTRLQNPEQYNAAVQSMGGDTYNTKVWWEK